MITRAAGQLLSWLHRVLTGKPLPDSRGEAEVWLAVSLLSALGLGSELANPTLGIDDYTHLNLAFDWSDFWIARGMWGGLLLGYLTPGQWITPFIALLVGIVLQALAAVVLGWALGLGRISQGRRVLLYALWGCFPYFAGQMAFSYLQISFPLASLLAFCGVLLVASAGLRRMIAGGLVLAAGISVYQGCIGVFAVAALLAPVFCHTLTDQECRLLPTLARHWLRLGLVAVIAAATYAGLHQMILAATGATPNNEFYSVSADLRFWRQWDSILRNAVTLVSGNDGMVPVQTVLLFLVAALLALTHSLRRFFMQHGWRGALSVPVFAVLLVFAPFAVMFIHPGALSPRSALGVPVIWLAVFSVLALSPAAHARVFLNLSLPVILLVFLFQNNRMFYAEYLVEKADAIAVSRIAERIAALDAANGEAPVEAAVVVGSYSPPPHPAIPRYCGSVLGYSQLEWVGGPMQWAVAKLARSIGIEEYGWVGPDALGEGVDVAALVSQRRPWPHPDAVFLHGSLAVVWLGQARAECGDGILARMFGGIGNP